MQRQEYRLGARVGRLPDRELRSGQVCKWTGINRHCITMHSNAQFRFEEVIVDCDVVLDTKSYVYEQRTLRSSQVLKPMVSACSSDIFGLHLSTRVNLSHVDCLFYHQGGVYINVLSSSNALVSDDRDKFGLTLPELRATKLLGVAIRYHLFLLVWSAATHLKYGFWQCRYGWNNMLHSCRLPEALFPHGKEGNDGRIVDPYDGCRQYHYLANVSPNGAQLREVMRLLQEGTVIPVVDLIYPMHCYYDAHSFVQSGRVRGKVVLQIEGCENMQSTLKIVTRGNLQVRIP